MKVKIKLKILSFRDEFSSVIVSVATMSGNA